MPVSALPCLTSSRLSDLTPYPTGTPSQLPRHNARRHHLLHRQTVLGQQTPQSRSSRHQQQEKGQGKKEQEQRRDLKLRRILIRQT